MMISRPFALVTLLAALAAAPAATAQTAEGIEGPGYTLNHVGSQHAAIMKGDRSAKIDLRTLEATPHLFALGPVEGMTGEITVIDGKPSIARIDQSGKVIVETRFNTGAAFLVWAETSGDWRKEKVPQTVRSIADLETHLASRAAALGLKQAFPFMLSGQVNGVDYHVLSAEPGKTYPAGMDAHKSLQTHMSAPAGAATFVGFYSRDHAGVFTHMGSATHIHFLTADGTHSGHAESIDFGSGDLFLSLPQ